MRHDIAAAIESACTSITGEPRIGKPIREHRFNYVRALVLAALRELPDGMSVAEVREELELEDKDFANGM